jgi:hypothetical protein
MDVQEKKALVAEIERFKEQALKMHIVQVLADTYERSSLFDYSIDSDGSVIWYKAQARQLWDFWQAKAQAVPEGFVLVPRLLSDVKADQFAESRFNEIKDLFYNDHMDLSGAERERLRLRWVKNRARASQEIYKAMIEAQEPANDSKN